MSIDQHLNCAWQSFPMWNVGKGKGQLITCNWRHRGKYRYVLLMLNLSAWWRCMVNTMPQLLGPREGAGALIEEAGVTQSRSEQVWRRRNHLPHRSLNPEPPNPFQVTILTTLCQIIYSFTSSLVFPPYRGEGVWVCQRPWELYQR
jgi:hypothetical protein